MVDNHVIRYNPPEVFAQSKHFDSQFCKDKSKVYGSLVVGAESADPQRVSFHYKSYLPIKKL